MSVSSRCFRVALLVLPIFVAHTASAQTGGGVQGDNGVLVSLPETRYANLSIWDCENNAPIDFQFSLDPTYGTLAVGDAAEFVLSTSSDCATPSGATFTGSSSCATDGNDIGCPSLLLQNNTTLASVGSGTVDWEDDAQFSTTPGLTTGGIWSVYTRLAANIGTSVSPCSTTDSTNTTECGPSGGVDNALLYICVIVSTSASGTTGVFPYGSLSIALNSTVPDAPAQPTVTPLDSALDVSWGPVSTAYYYIVHVTLASSSADGGGDADAGDTGIGADVVAPVITSDTSAMVAGLQNGIAYNVYIVSADDSGSNPPVSSNLSGPSPIASGTPYEGKSKAETGCASGGGGGLTASVVLLVALEALRRRRAGRRAIITDHAGGGAA